jgi:alanyl-tRNA synthetase
VKPDELKAVEEIVNDSIRTNMPVCIRQMKLDEARKAGATALFGEKYGEVVRSVTVQDDCSTKPFSMELCGGTHVNRTGDIGMFKITSESSVAAGTRRIEAVVGKAAEKYVDSLEKTLDDIAFRFKVAQSEVPVRIDRLMAQQKELEKEISKLKSQLASGGTGDLMKNVREVAGVKLLSGMLPDMDTKSLRELSDNLKVKLGSGIIVLASVIEDKVSFIVAVTPDLIKAGYAAGKIAKNVSTLIGGSGGGKPDFAQGGGKDASKIDSALAKLPEMLK